MRVGTAPSDAPNDRYMLPARNLFDLVATNDLTSLLTLVRGVNPFDHSPGMQLILARMDERPESAHPFVVTTAELDVDPATIGTARDARGITALHVAAGCGHAMLARVLIDECGADVNATDVTGATPMHAAARNGYVDCVQLLLDRGGEPRAVMAHGAAASDCRQTAGRTALFLSHFNGHYVTAGLLSSHFAELSKRVPHAEDAVGPMAQKLATMIRAEDVSAFAYFFDVADCERAGCGPLLSARPPPSKEAMTACLLDSEETMQCLLPATTDMSPALLFIFDGLVHRGFLRGHDQSDERRLSFPQATRDRLLLHVLRAGQVGALRCLLREQYAVPLDRPLIMVLPPREERQDSSRLGHMALLLEEARLLVAYKRAVESYSHKPDSKARKQAAWAAKVALRRKQKELAQASLESLLAEL